MKFLGYLFIFGLIGFNSCQYTGIGIRKSEAYVKKLFADTFNYVFPLIHYIEFYDISIPFNKMVFDSKLTLSEIRLSKLTFNDKLDFEVVNEGKSLIIKNGKDIGNLNIKAELSARWTYSFGPAKTQGGTYNAKLEANGKAFNFEFAEDYSKSKSRMENAWKVSSSEIKGFGAYGKIREAIDGMVKDQLFSKIDEEINKYGALLMNLMTYGKSLRRIKVEGRIEKSNPFVLMSEVVGMVNPQPKTPFNVKYESIIMDEMTHKKAILNESFTANNDIKHNVSFYIGLGAAKTILKHYITTAFESFLIDSTKQNEIFKDPLSIRLLASFYPRLAERFDLSEEVDLSCTILTADMDEVKYTCAFSLAHSKNVVVLLIDELQWKNLGELSFDDTSKTVVIKNKVTSFSSIVIKSVYIEEYVARQLMFFLKPLSDYLADTSMVKIYPNIDENLDYAGSESHAGESFEVWYKVKE